MRRKATTERVQKNQRLSASETPQTVVLSEHGARGPELPDGWRAAFLQAFSQTGTLWKSARLAGVNVRTVKRHLDADPDFAEAYEDARQEYADSLEHGFDHLFRNKGNVIAGIVLAKKHRPQDYIERVQTQNINVSVNVDADPAELQGFLAQLMSSATGATRAELQAMRALPSAPAPDLASSCSTPQAHP